MFEILIFLDDLEISVNFSKSQMILEDLGIFQIILIILDEYLYLSTFWKINFWNLSTYWKTKFSNL